MKKICYAIATCMLVIMFLCASGVGRAQSLLGRWQLVKETTCLESNIFGESDSTQMLIDDMKSMSRPAAQTITFKEKGSGVESTRILNKKKTSNNNNFLYKLTDETLLILDKKSQTITETFTVDRLDPDSLIISNAKRACETKVFVKIKESKK